nr:coat protein [Pfaffia mosaic virus]
AKDTIDGGGSNTTDASPDIQPKANVEKDKEVKPGITGTHNEPKIKAGSSKSRKPTNNGASVLNTEPLIESIPQKIEVANTRTTQSQIGTWYEAHRIAYEPGQVERSTVINGLVVWCIENGTSPNINGVWIMMDGNEQVEYPLKPVVENAKPTLRQIMAHFSDVAEAYITMRNEKEPYMPRYGLVRNLRDMSLARYAFDFYEVTSRTPTRAREAHIQMKAAALKSAQTRMFGLDGGISTQEENTERHTTEDVSPNMHSFLGVRNT